MTMRSRLASFSCLALVAMLCTAAVADAAYRVPFRHARWPNVTISPDPSGPAALLAVHNTDDDPVDIAVVIHDSQGRTAWSSAYVLDPKQTKTWNLRSLGLPYTPTEEYPEGIFTGYIEIFGARRVLIGDVLPVDSGKSLAEGNQLLPHREECVPVCDHFVMRYIQGGPFAGGTEVQVLRERHAFGGDVIAGEFFDEPGNHLSDFTLADWPLSFELDIADYAPSEPFGTLYLDNVVAGAVTATYSGFGLYSVGLEAWCIPACDPCDRSGPCFEEGSPSCGSDCVAADLELSGGTTCVVGSPFAAVLTATGTQLEPITCTALPNGLVRTGNHVTGTCDDTLVAEFTCSVENACGEDSVTVPVVRGDAPPVIPPCAEATAPEITLTPDVTTTATEVIVNAIAATPSGGTFTPTVPQTYARPGAGSPAQTRTFTYTLTFFPTTGQACEAQESVDVSVPAQGAEAECSECLGKVSLLTLRFLSDEGGLVEVIAKHGATNVTVYAGFVAGGGEFDLVGASSTRGGFDGTLGTEIEIYVDGTLHTTIHTSCSQPIGPGLTAGQFVVVRGESTEGGTLCAV